MTLRVSKCRFLETKIEYLGHEITSEGIRPGYDKIKTISEFSNPKNDHEVRRYLGITSYSRKIIQGFADTAKPLTHLNKKNQASICCESQDKAFRILKDKLVETRRQLYSRSAATEVPCDASQFDPGGILLQQQKNDTLKPVQ